VYICLERAILFSVILVMEDVIFSILWHSALLVVLAISGGLG